MTRQVAVTILLSIFASVSAPVFLGAAAADGDSEVTEAPTISAEKLAEQRDTKGAPLVIDVRTPAEFASGHIPGAVNIPFDQVAERIEDLDTPNGVALYCMVGPRARKGESALLAAGYEKVFHLDGGLAAWQAAGLPVEHAP
jgi:phage shock protein E